MMSRTLDHSEHERHDDRHHAELKTTGKVVPKKMGDAMICDELTFLFKICTVR